MLFLKKYVKYRKEDGYLLICDCSNIQNYELDLETFDLFECLRKGYDPQKPLNIELESDIIDDLISLGLVDSVPDSNSGFNKKRWIDLGYEESEFF